jgi:acyl carrier protein
MYEQLKAILTSKFKVPSEQLVSGANFADLGLDSLDLVELSLVIEQEMGARISDDELAEVDGLATVAELIQIRSVAA